MIARGEIFLTVLGEEAERLHPEILAQMRAPAPAGGERDDGVFTVAGSRLGRLTALAIPVVGPRMLVTRFARDVPFTLTATPGRDSSGRSTLDSTREFRFPDVTQFISDRLTATPRHGVVHNVLGERGRLQLLEQCSVTSGGALRMDSLRVALRIGGRRLPLGGILGVTVALEDGWDEQQKRRTIAMTVKNPLLGTILEYRGWYRYADADTTDAGSGEAQ